MDNDSQNRCFELAKCRSKSFRAVSDAAGLYQCMADRSNPPIDPSIPVERKAARFEPLQINLGTAEGCTLDLTTMTTKDRLNEFVAKIKSKASKCVAGCNIDSDNANDITIVDSNSFIIGVRNAKHVQKLEECFIGRNVEDCPIASFGQEPSTSSSTSTSSTSTTDDSSGELGP